jgi:adenylyl cyclase-associated protein
MERLYSLEAATSRLEDMAMSLDDPNVSKGTGSPSAAAPATPELPKPAPPPPAPPAAPQVPPQIQDFDALIKGDVQTFVNLGEKVGGLVAEQVRTRPR